MQQIRSVIHHHLTDVVLYGVVADGGPVISRVLVGSSARSDIASVPKIAEPALVLQEVAALVSRYLEGIPVDFSGIALATATLTPFTSAVLDAARSVEFGCTCSYSKLAQRAGYPGAVRAAASVMRNNRWPLLVPCHRIVRKDGSAGAYNGDFSGDDAALKKKLLQMERVHLKQ